jgi:NAD(P)-dependent dehydrogenase (short-subunit alcohol dehydrogenase family)
MINMSVKLQDKTILRNDPERFAGEVALVTGAGSGIGRAAALAFGRQGAAVALVGRRVPELETVAREIADTGGTAMIAPADITDERAVEKMIGAVVEQFGWLEIAFNNAGIAAYKSIEDDDG